MKAILADHNLIGQVRAIVARLEEDPWPELWAALGLRVFTLSDLGLDERTPDDVIWRRCQAEQIILITANRNQDGPDSLGAMIAHENAPTSLPVFTISVADQVLIDKEYRDRVAKRLIEYLYEIDTVRGTGRLFLP